MKLSEIFIPTLRTAPSDAEGDGNRMLHRAGYIFSGADGSISLLPMGILLRDRLLETMVSQLMHLGGNEIALPALKSSVISSEEFHPEMLEIIRARIRSHRQLPLILYTRQTRERSDFSQRRGLIYSRTTTFLDVYSMTAGGLESSRQSDSIQDILENMLRESEFPVNHLLVDTGVNGANTADGHYYLSPLGVDQIAVCRSCGYAAELSIATFASSSPITEASQPLKKVATPHAVTIQQLADFLNIPIAKTAKAIFYMAGFTVQPDEKFIFAITRGDMDVNEAKLKRILGAESLRPAVESEITSIGAVPGYASPIGLRKSGSFLTMVDQMVPQCNNLVAGANEEGFHFLNTNYQRDYQADIIADITSVKPGYGCPKCGHPLVVEPGFILTKNLGFDPDFGSKHGCFVQDDKGINQPIWMERYRIDLDRWMGCLAEEHHDELGLCLPLASAPFQVELIALTGKTLDVMHPAKELYQSLVDTGLDVLFDDRTESPGIKFNDADLIGCPIRLTIGERSLSQGGVEMKTRRDGVMRSVKLDQIIQEVEFALIPH